MKSLQDLDIFVRTVDSGSLSATARALDLTPAAASAALKRLEAELGVALFVRSTRSLRLTQEGALFLEHCRPALAALQQVQGQLAGGRAGGLRGTLQLAAPSDLGRNVLLPWLDAFQAEHPGIDIRLQLADRVANVYSEPVDAAFRYGKPQDSSLVALPLAELLLRTFMSTGFTETACTSTSRSRPVATGSGRVMSSRDSGWSMGWAVW